MSATNGDGIIKVGRRGIRKFEFGDEAGSVTIELDVIGVWDEWVEIDHSFRDEKGVILKDRLVERNTRCRTWVQGMIEAAGGVTNAEDASHVAQHLSLTDALTFMKLLCEEVEKLKVFFERSTGEKPSSGVSSGDARVTYEQ
jgi:hypothetical protein